MNTESQTPHDEATPAYADRPYERQLSESGRKFVSLDLDESIVRTIDELRGNRRRGLEVEALLRRALSMETAMT